jgi:hypothetical protein
LRQQKSTEAVFDVDCQATQEMDLFMDEDKIVALLLKSEQLLHEIEVRRESGNEGHT